MPSCKDDAIFPLSQFKIQDIFPEGKRDGFSHSARNDSVIQHNPICKAISMEKGNNGSVVI